VQGNISTPPFPPVLRGQDSVFSAAVAAIHATPRLWYPTIVQHKRLHAHPCELLPAVTSCSRALSYLTLELANRVTSVEALGLALLDVLSRPRAICDRLYQHALSDLKRLQRMITESRWSDGSGKDAMIKGISAEFLQWERAGSERWYEGH